MTKKKTLPFEIRPGSLGFLTAALHHATVPAAGLERCLQRFRAETDERELEKMVSDGIYNRIKPCLLHFADTLGEISGGTLYSASVEACVFQRRRGHASMQTIEYGRDKTKMHM